METVWLKASKHLEAIELEAAKMLVDTSLEEMPLIQIHILDALYQQNPQHASSLAKACGRAATSFTPILDKAEFRKLIFRMPDPNDRRAVFIHLTPKGLALRDDVQKALEQLNAKFANQRMAVKS